MGPIGSNEFFEVRTVVPVHFDLHIISVIKVSSSMILIIARTFYFWTVGRVSDWLSILLKGGKLMEGGKIMVLQVRVCLAVLLAFSLLFAGCATTPKEVPLKSEMGAKIHSTRVVIISAQNEIIAEIEPSQVAVGTGGGCLPALIDAGIEGRRAKRAETLIQPIRNSLADYDLGENFRASMEAAMGGIGWLHVQETGIQYDTTPNLVQKLLKDTPYDTLATIQPEYFMAPDFASLKMTAVLEIHSKEGPQSMYRDKAEYSFRLPDAPKDKDIAVQNWIKDKGEPMRGAVEEGVKSLTYQLIKELQDPYSMNATQ